MRGMSAITGAALEGTAHLAQSIGDILSTPVGSRVMRRDYGSLLPRLIDQPFNGATRIRLYAAIATALMRWEPRIRLTRIDIALGDQPGSGIVALYGQTADTATPSPVAITVPLPLSAA